MRKANNEEIRTALRYSGVYKYEVAHELGITDSWFSKLLRYELPDEKKREIMQAIFRVRERNANVESD